MNTALPIPVMCLAKQNGVGLRVPLDETREHLGSRFCGTCPARFPCYSHHGRPLQWPYPGSLVWCRDMTDAANPVRVTLREAAGNRNGGEACQKCRPDVQNSCSQLHATLSGQTDLFRSRHRLA